MGIRQKWQLSTFDIAGNIGNTTEGESMKLLSLFSGIGAFEKALDNLQIPYELH